MREKSDDAVHNFTSKVKFNRYTLYIISLDSYVIL